MKTPVLFCRSDSNYATQPDADIWTMERDARRWPGGRALIAHPPCRAWGQLRTFAKPRPDEKELATWAIAQVRQWGGVLEHPHKSTLWRAIEAAPPGTRDRYGGWLLPIHQHHFGHRAEKKTFLYIVGASPSELPRIPYVMSEPTHVIQSNGRHNNRPHTTKAEREHTPPQLARWLLDLAATIQRNQETRPTKTTV